MKRVYVWEDGKLREIDAWRKPLREALKEATEKMDDLKKLQAR